MIEPTINAADPQPPEPVRLTEDEMVNRSDVLGRAFKVGAVSRMWAKYVSGPREGERVIVLGVVNRTTLPNGDIAVAITPLAEILPVDPFTCLDMDGDVNPPADAPRVIVVGADALPKAGK